MTLSENLKLKVQPALRLTLSVNLTLVKTLYST